MLILTLLFALAFGQSCFSDGDCAKNEYCGADGCAPSACSEDLQCHYLFFKAAVPTDARDQVCINGCLSSPQCIVPGGVDTCAGGLKCDHGVCCPPRPHYTIEELMMGFYWVKDECTERPYGSNEPADSYDE